jgi:hypothetical protein
MADDMKVLQHQLTRAGWNVFKTPKHVKAIHPKGGMVCMSSTPSCPYAVNNVIRDVNRILAKHGEAPLS